MAKPAHTHFVFVKDGFYDHIARVHRAAQKIPYHELEHATGWRSVSVYHEPGARQKLERLLGVRITRWDTDPAEENGVFYQGFSQGDRAEVPGIHADWPFDDITVLIYLTPGLPDDCGTSLWRHKRTGLMQAPTAADARRLHMPLADLREMLDADTRRRDRWIETDRIGYQCNRMVAYRSGCFHSATRHFGSGNANGRLYQTYRVGVDWASFRAA